MSLLWGGAVAAVVVAVGAGLADRGRRRRADLDRVGWVDWPTVQIAALIAGAVMVALAVRG